MFLSRAARSGCATLCKTCRMNLHERFSPHNANAHFMYLYTSLEVAHCVHFVPFPFHEKRCGVPIRKRWCHRVGPAARTSTLLSASKRPASADCFTPAPKKTFRAHESKTARLLLAPRTIWGGFRALKWSGFVPAWMSWLSAGANVARNSGRLCGERLGTAA